MKKKQLRSQREEGSSPLFASDPDFWHNAYLKRVPMPWSLYADGYRKAADLLIDHCDTSYDKNTLVYPVAFLYRQYIELALKEIIFDGNKVVQKPYDIPKHHRLEATWQICRSIVLERDLPVSKEQLSNVEDYIKQFSRLDPTSEAFRYPVTKDGAPSMPPTVESVSIRGLARAMTSLADSLKQISSLLNADINLEEEFRADLYLDE